MRSPVYLLATALTVGLSGAAMAQTNPSAPAPTSTPAPPLAPTNDLGLTRSHWLVSGSVGSNFGSTASDISAQDRASWDFGGQAAYLWRGVIGGEFLANFTPSFRVDTVLDLENPHVNSYMANAIAALPIGANGQFQPYLSGGMGGMQMRFANIANTDISSNKARWGANVGAGIMAFAGSNFGIRADARYYTTTTTTRSTGDIADQVTESLLSGLDFWRTNVGVAYQW